MAGMQYEIADIRKDISDMNLKLNVLISASTNKTNISQKVSKFSFPLMTHEDLNRLESMLQNDEGAFQDLVDMLSRVGGATLKKTVLMMIKKVMSRDLSLEYSAYGRKQKKNFSKLNLYRAILEAVKVNETGATDVDITKTIGAVLACAGDWDGGRLNRQSGEFACDNCGKRFSKRKSWYAHIKNYCGVERKYPCPVEYCLHRAQLRFDLKRHIASRHPDYHDNYDNNT